MELSSRVNAWDVQGMGYLNYARFNRERLSSFHQLDIRVDKQFYLNNFSLMLYLDVQNVYNFKATQPPILILEEDEAGMPIVYEENGIMRYRLKELQNNIGNILPSIGIIIII